MFDTGKSTHNDTSSHSLVATLIFNLIIIPAKAMDYVFTGVGLSVCLFVCYHDN